MAPVSNAMFPCLWRRWLRAVMTTVAAVTMLAVTACTGPDEGTLDKETAATSEESETVEPRFAHEIPEDICPTADTIPEAFAAPEEPGYTIESESHMNEVHPYHECGYGFNDDLESLDGTQAVKNASFQFYIIDDPSTNAFVPSDYPQVSFEVVEEAEYFRHWDRVGNRSQNYLNADSSYGLKESECISFQFLATIDNLYVYSSLFFVMPYDGSNPDFDLDVDNAAYQIIEAIVAPVVADLERQ